jgi:hypothetical protein
MPLTEKGRKIKRSMQKQYGKKAGERVFYASKNKGTIKGVDKGGPRGHGGMKRNRHGATEWERGFPDMTNRR